MASLNTAARELVLKIVYYGPGLGGKTTSLQALHETAPPERRGKLVSLATPVDRTLYFDFLPLRLPSLRGLAVRLQLFTVPGQVYFNATRRLVLSGADGIVFVADSQIERLDANLESLENLRDNLAEHGRDLSALPHAFAWNKRDLDNALPEHELDRLLNQYGAPNCGTIATQGVNVDITLDSITKQVLAAYEAQIPVSYGTIHPPTTVTLAPPMVSMQRTRDDGVETSAWPEAYRQDEPSADLLTSSTLLSPREGTYLADLERIEATAGADGDAESPPASSMLDVAEVGSLFRPSSAVPGPQNPAAGARGSRMPAETPAAPPTPSRPPKTGTDTPPPGSLSFALLFAPTERAIVEQIEASMVHGAYADALTLCEAALRRLFAAIASVVGNEGGPSHEPLFLLGLDGRRYLSFRALAKRARHVGDVGMLDVLESYAFLLEARVAAGRWDGIRSLAGAASQPPPPEPSPRRTVARPPGPDDSTLQEGRLSATAGEPTRESRTPQPIANVGESPEEPTGENAKQRPEPGAANTLMDPTVRDTATPTLAVAIDDPSRGPS